MTINWNEYPEKCPHCGKTLKITGSVHRCKGRGCKWITCSADYGVAGCGSAVNKRGDHVHKEKAAETCMEKRSAA